MRPFHTLPTPARADASGADARARRTTALWATALCVLGVMAVSGVQAQGLRLGGPTAAPAASAPAAASPAASPATSPRTGDFIVAVVNSEPITNNEVNARVRRLQQELAQRGGSVPPREALLGEVLELLISERAQLQLARESGIKVDDAQVDQAELGIARQNGIDRAELQRRLQQDGIALVVFRRELREQITLQRLRDREVEPQVRVSDVEVDRFIDEQRAQAGAGAVSLNLAQVLVVVPENASAEQVATLKRKADAVLARARAGEDFAKLVREASDAPEASRTGGQMGLRPADRYPQLFLDAVQSVPEGGVSAVIRSGAGFHVLKVVERRTAGIGGGTVVQTRARHILLRPSPQLSEEQARTRLADLRRRVVAGTADFASLAREFSQDGSAAGGGDLGWASPGQFVPEFEAVMADLRPGDLSEPFASRFGLHLVQVMERREAQLSQREQRDLVRGAVRERKLDEAYANWVREVRDRAFVQLREPPQ